ncbi:hypothetical protein PGT21_008599, partial [Puccinia graminis f. sp. tritici]
MWQKVLLMGLCSAIYLPKGCIGPPPSIENIGKTDASLHEIAVHQVSQSIFPGHSKDFPLVKDLVIRNTDEIQKNTPLISSKSNKQEEDFLQGEDLLDKEILKHTG